MTKVLFTKKGCEKCDFVKEALPANYDIQLIDIGTPDGLARLSWLSLVNAAQTKLPIYAEFSPRVNELLPEISNVITGAIQIKNYISEHAV